MGTTIKELLLYRYRYVFGYAILVILSVGLIAWQLGGIPPGFSEVEQQSAVASHSLTTESTSFINLPYHLLQKGTLELFGPTAFGIRLSSVILGLLVATGAYFLLRRWFGESLAVIGTVLVVTSAHFLDRGRTGSPLILYILWPTLLLLTASYANTQGKNWRLWVWLFAIIAALALYTPYLGFLIAIILMVAFASRQGRGLISEIGSPIAMLSGVVFCVLLIPLGWGIYNHPESALGYLGFVDAPSFAFVLERIKEISKTLIDIRLDDNQRFAPVLSIPALLLGSYGLWHCFKTMARSRYAMIVLWLFTATALYLSAESAPTVLLFVPVSLIIIIGLHRFIRRWYEIFPRNPYARMAALLPIALILLVTVQFSFNRYFYGTPRSDSVRQVYDEDILLVGNRLQKETALQNATLVVDEKKREFFSLLQKQHIDLRVVSSTGQARSGGPLILSEETYAALTSKQRQNLAARSTQLLVDSRPDNDALRFRVYQ